MTKNIEDVRLARIERALRTVTDPCTAAAGLPLSIVDLGLIRDIEVNGDHVELQVTLTEPGCPFLHRVLDAIYRSLDHLDEVRSVHVQLTWAPPWTPNDLSPFARHKLHRARQRMTNRMNPTSPISLILK